MSVSLDNLNISLDNFNAAASGKYNIGQIKLNSDGTGVYRANSHKTWTIFNKTEISQEEAVAVKEAFCRAVKAEAKLDDTAVQELKEKLGIGKSKFSSMKAGTMKALTAVEVREVIDKYANQINQRRTEGPQLKTSNDLYKGVSQETLDSRAQVRDKINSQTLANFAPSEADISLSSLMDIMAYEGGDSISNDTKELAKAIFARCKKPIKPGIEISPYKDSPISLVLKNDMTFSAIVTLDNGSDFSVDLGLTQKQMLQKLANMFRSLAVDARFAADAQKLAEEKGLVVKPKEEAKPKEEEKLDANPKAKKVLKINDPLSLTKPEVDALKRKVLNMTKESLETIKTIDSRNNPGALQNYRKNKDRLENNNLLLQAALIAVRGHDPRNALLGNRLRDLFLVDANAKGKEPVDTNALCDKLLEDITEALSKERPNIRDVVDKNIEEMGKTEESKILQQQLDNDADDLPALNIGQLTGTGD